jgi:O-glycosyl hydrolase
MTDLGKLESLVQKVSQAVKDLRSVLESNQVDALEAILVQTSKALEAINGYGGSLESSEGVRKLKADILSLPESDSQRLMTTLEQASIDHQVNGELIKLAMQRSAALQSFVAQQSLAATYEIGGGIPGRSGSLLSKKV